MPIDSAVGGDNAAVNVDTEAGADAKDAAVISRHVVMRGMAVFDGDEVGVGEADDVDNLLGIIGRQTLWRT